VWQKKKVSCEEKWPLDSDSWGSIKQPYVGGFSRSIRRGEFFNPKVWNCCYRIVDYFNENFWNLQDRLIQLKGNFEFFQHFSFTPLSRSEVFCWKSFDTFEIIKHAILDLLGHGIQILITRSIDPSKKSTLNFLQNFSSIPFSRNDF